MRAFVFTDKSLERRAGQFVWLSINTEKSSNAPFLAKFPVEAFPSFFIIDPRSEKVALRWVGGATVGQVSKILDDGRRAVSGGERGVEEILARADRLYGERKNAEAIQEYRRALSSAPPGWSHDARATESLLFALQSVKDQKACAQTARDAFPRLARTSSAANVAGTGLSCALDVDKEDPDRGSLISSLAADSRAVIASPAPDTAADDVSSVYQTLADEREAANDTEGRTKFLTEWASYLEGQASRAGSPEARAVFDSHRVSAYIALGQPERALPMLEASEKDLPGDYNPPARLALVYRAMKHWDEALAASDRALVKAYGPRKLGILSTRADIYAEKGDSAAARRTLEEAIQFAHDLPQAQRSERMVAALKKKLASLS